MEMQNHLMGDHQDMDSQTIVLAIVLATALISSIVGVVNANMHRRCRWQHGDPVTSFDYRYRMKAFIREGNVLYSNAMPRDDADLLLSELRSRDIVSGGHIEVYVDGPGWVVCESPIQQE